MPVSMLATAGVVVVVTENALRKDNPRCARRRMFGIFNDEANTLSALRQSMQRNSISGLSDKTKPLSDEHLNRFFISVSVPVENQYEAKINDGADQ